MREVPFSLRNLSGTWNLDRNSGTQACFLLSFHPQVGAALLPGVFFRKFALPLHMKHQVTTFDIFNDQK